VTVILATIGAIGGIFGMSEAGAAFNLTESWGFWLVTVSAHPAALDRVRAVAPKVLWG